jgi:predicted nucleotidyltransferase
LQRELARLESAGLVHVAHQGNQKRYQANQEAPIFGELRGIVLKTFGLAYVLREALAPVGDRIRAAFVFGSVAKGADRADSDVDVLVISDDLGYGELIAALEPAEARLGRKLNPAIYSFRDWRKRYAEGNAFVSRVQEGPKIWLLGNEDALR